MTHSLSQSLRRRVRSLLMPSTAVLAGTLIWEGAGRILGFHPDILPTPSRIVLEALSESDKLIPHGLITTAEVIGGLIFSAACSALIALAALIPAVYRFLAPALAAARRAPLIVAAPLAFIWFGFGSVSILVLASLLALPGLSLGLVTGMKSAPGDVIDLAHLAGAGPISILLKIRIPSSLPTVFAAIKSAVPVVVATVAVGEFLDGEKGLGYLMLAATSKMETTFMFAALTLTLLLGLLLYSGVAFVELAFLHNRCE